MAKFVALLAAAAAASAAIAKPVVVNAYAFSL